MVILISYRSNLKARGVSVEKKRENENVEGKGGIKQHSNFLRTILVLQAINSSMNGVCVVPDNETSALLSAIQNSQCAIKCRSYASWKPGPMSGDYKNKLSNISMHS
jgi:hypothetical protein